MWIYHLPDLHEIFGARCGGKIPLLLMLEFDVWNCDGSWICDDCGGIWLRKGSCNCDGIIEIWS